MNVWRAPGMPALLASSALGFTGFALLLPVAPLWAVRVGADSLGAGLVNTVLMACTVLAQVLVGQVLRRVSWGATVAVGLVLLGLPAIVHLWAGSLWLLLVLAALRGFGFGILTVCAVDGIAGLFSQDQRGRAVGVYGLAIAAPQFVLTPAAPWLAEHVGFGWVFGLAGAPLLGVPLVLRFTHPQPHQPEDRRITGLRRVLSPIAVLVVITASGGAILTFAPQFAGSGTAFAALMALTGTTALARWLIGGVADRIGPARFIGPMLALGAAALVVIAVGILHSGVAVVVGSALLGIAYGGLQNLTLVQAFAAGGESARGAVSVAWNVGFDAGTGLGALAVGALATSTSFSTAFAVMAAGCVAVAGATGIRRPHQR